MYEEQRAAVNEDAISYAYMQLLALEPDPIPALAVQLNLSF